jgi:hypothetical protein
MSNHKDQQLLVIFDKKYCNEYDATTNGEPRQGGHIRKLFCTDRLECEDSRAFFLEVSIQMLQQSEISA